MLFFYVNKGFHSRMSFDLDIIDYIIDYIIIRKRLNVAKMQDIIDRIQDVLNYIREKLKKSQLIIIEQINRYKKEITFKKGDLVFLSIKNIVIDKSYKKLNDKMLDLFKVISIIDSFYKLKLSEIIRIYNIFHFKFLNLIVINSLPNQKNPSFKIIIVKDKKE